MFVKIDWDSDDIGDVDELLVVESELEKNKVVITDEAKGCESKDFFNGFKMIKEKA